MAARRRGAVRGRLGRQLLGTAYGLILVGGLTTVEGLAHPDDLGTINAVFYSLTYVGFAAPLVSTLALRRLSPEELMLVGVAVIALTTPMVLMSLGRWVAGTPTPSLDDRDDVVGP